MKVDVRDTVADICLLTKQFVVSPFCQQPDHKDCSWSSFHPGKHQNGHHIQHNLSVSVSHCLRCTDLQLARFPLHHRLRRGYSLSLKTVGALLRWVFPRTRQKVRARYLDFQHDTVPYLKHRATSRIYRAIIERQTRRSRKLGLNPVGLHAHQRRLARRPSTWPLHWASAKRAGAKDAVRPRSGIFTSFTEMESRGEGYSLGVDGADEGRDRGTRRQKVYSYFKAANELRQAYSLQWTQRNQGIQSSSRDVSGDFSDFEMVRSGKEEMVLFPSYARRHIKEDQSNKGYEWPFDEEDGEKAQTQGMEYWESIWHRYQSDNAVVDVDVRGWIYSPHQGPLNRKNRFLITLARKLSGIPAPGQVPTTNNNAFEGQAGSSDKGQGEVMDNSQLASLTQDEISAANAQLMDRLRPFLTDPAVGVPATVFFYNDNKSESRTVLTNEGGHFAVRASLDFIPSHIRVLTSENLSATEEVKIIEPYGVSLISDIDDTIKHSAIMSGAKEMFRNTFVRNLSDLTVLGVKEWYSRVADLGVGIHYVSNSPWQLYPLLKNYLNFVGLPPGSVHLKQYSGMLQGIFEPTADRKRPTLERILQDFPERQFILVGDSGEADLEVYTDLVIANPGRIIAIFIRDVTTPVRNEFFDKSVPHLEKPLSRNSTWSTVNTTPDTIEKRPPLPPRNVPQDRPCNSNLTMGNLIDLEDATSTDPKQFGISRKLMNDRATPPIPPSKPENLRGGFVETYGHKEPEFATAVRRKAVPPPPTKPRALQIDGTAIHRPSSGATTPGHTFTSNTHTISPRRSKEPPPTPPPRRSGSSNLEKLQLASDTQPGISQRSRSSTSLADRTLTRPPNSSPASTIPTPRTGTPQSSLSSDAPTQLPSKREEAWRRRWARAQEILNSRGVALHSWKTGFDAEDLCARLVRQAQNDMETLNLSKQ